MVNYRLSTSEIIPSDRVLSMGSALFASMRPVDPVICISQTTPQRSIKKKTVAIPFGLINRPALPNKRLSAPSFMPFLVETGHSTSNNVLFYILEQKVPTRGHYCPSMSMWMSPAIKSWMVILSSCIALLEQKIPIVGSSPIGKPKVHSYEMNELKMYPNQRKYVRHGGVMNLLTNPINIKLPRGSKWDWPHRFCLPFAAKPSNVWRSALSSLFAAVMAPVKLDLIRAGVTDLGSMTIPLATNKYPVNVISS